MLNRANLLNQTKEYVKKHPPNTGYTLAAMEKVCSMIYPDCTNILVQFALQFDGKETIEDLTQWDKPERRLPYGDGRSLDKRSDCSSWVQNLIDIFFGIDIGTWTEGIWAKYKGHQVKLEELRAGDLIFWNFKKGRNVSHVALYIGGGKIMHTTSTGNPLRVDTAMYSASKRVACVRILTDEQYESLLFKAEIQSTPQPYLTPSPASAPVPEVKPKYVQYAGRKGVNVRQKPSALSARIGFVSFTEIVEKLGVSGAWLKIKTKSGKIGYCSYKDNFIEIK